MARIPSHGGYRNLKSFQQVEAVYDATVRFCERFIDKRSRLHDQMVQTARSGRQRARLLRPFGPRNDIE